ncbi:MAG: XdhC family protein [Draconibacterium sp.]|nr:XdhC family protein [Draconibacterium sp.]
MGETYNKKNIYFELSELIRKKIPCVLSTVTKTGGSTPQKPGSSAIFGQNGLLAGTIGGGAVELTIQKQAVSAVQTKKSAYYEFNLDNNISDLTGAICGGAMNIMLDANPEKHIKVFEECKKSCISRVPGVLVTVFSSKESGKTSIERMWVTNESYSAISTNLNVEIALAVKNMLNKSIQNDFDEIRFQAQIAEEKDIAFLETIVPLSQLIIAGAGHVGKALSHLGNLLDFEVTVWDDRTEFANKKNLPDAQSILCGNLEESFGKIEIDHATYLIIVTRGHNDDADVLKKFIGSPAAYIGMIGSRRKIALVRVKFLTQKWATPEQWDKIYAPIGIEINSKTVQEIALSIAAQLVQVRYQKNRRNE